MFVHNGKYVAVPLPLIAFGMSSIFASITSPLDDTDKRYEVVPVYVPEP